jgi:hypothetical protein
MDDEFLNSPRGSEKPEGGLNLKAAVRRARIEESERSDVAHELRAAEVSRLDILRERLEPVFSQVPKEADLFDHGLVAGERPRLYVDMVAFIEMSRDRRTYRFLLDTRFGRKLLSESEDPGVIAEAATAYLGRRLIERERALASALEEDLGLARSKLELDAPKHELKSIPVVTERQAKRSMSATSAFIIGLAIGLILFFVYENWDDVIQPWLTDMLNQLGFSLPYKA